VLLNLIDQQLDGAMLLAKLQMLLAKRQKCQTTHSASIRRWIQDMRSQQPPQNMRQSTSDPTAAFFPAPTF
jgi:hypothetical protein